MPDSDFRIDPRSGEVTIGTHITGGDLTRVVPASDGVAIHLATGDSMPRLDFLSQVELAPDVDEDMLVRGNGVELVLKRLGLSQYARNVGQIEIGQQVGETYIRFHTTQPLSPDAMESMAHDVTGSLNRITAGNGNPILPHEARLAIAEHTGVPLNGSGRPDIALDMQTQRVTIQPGVLDLPERGLPQSPGLVAANTKMGVQLDLIPPPGIDSSELGNAARELASRLNDAGLAGTVANGSAVTLPRGTTFRSLKFALAADAVPAQAAQTLVKLDMPDLVMPPMRMQGQGMGYTATAASQQQLQQQQQGSALARRALPEPEPHRGPMEPMDSVRDRFSAAPSELPAANLNDAPPTFGESLKGAGARSTAMFGAAALLDTGWNAATHGREAYQHGEGFGGAARETAKGVWNDGGAALSSASGYGEFKRGEHAQGALSLTATSVSIGVPVAAGMSLVPAYATGAVLTAPLLQLKSSLHALDREARADRVPASVIDTLVNAPATDIPALAQLRHYRALAKAEGKPDTVDMQVSQQGNVVKYTNYGNPVFDGVGGEVLVTTVPIGPEMRRAAGRYLAEHPEQEATLLARAKASMVSNPNIRGGQSYDGAPQPGTHAQAADNAATRSR